MLLNKAQEINSLEIFSLLEHFLLILRGLSHKPETECSVELFYPSEKLLQGGCSSTKSLVAIFLIMLANILAASAFLRIEKLLMLR